MSRSRIPLRIGVLAALAISLAPHAVPAMQFTCPQSSGHNTGPDCHCPEENDCVATVTITPGGQPLACGMCTWTFSYSIVCPGGCAMDSDAGSVSIDCTPHARDRKEVKIKCPASPSYDDWLVMNFGCGYCH